MLTIDSTKWLLGKLRLLIEKGLCVDFVGSRKGSKYDTIVRVKLKRGRNFLSIMFFSSSFARGFKLLSFPKGKILDGWKDLPKALEWVMDLNPKSMVIW